MIQDLYIWLHNNPFYKKAEAKPHSDAILQQLLQNALNTSLPVKIYKNSNGKPYVKEPLYFSHSNSRNLYAYVVSTKADVAIDIETIKKHRGVMKLASRYFHTDESQKLNTLSCEDQLAYFYQWWTRKEAWCKLDGGNLWSYLNRSVLTDNLIKTQQGELIQMQQITDIDGFAGTIASSETIKHVWINNIA